jgi:integral membrane protein (TIGR01906 family)
VKRRSGASLLGAVFGVAWAALVVGVSIAALTTPSYTARAVRLLDIPATSGLSVEDAVMLSAQVRALVADQEYDPLPAWWHGQPAFDPTAVSHLTDVRRVLAAARLATGAAAAILAAFLAYCVGRRRWRLLRSSMRIAGWMVVGVVGIAAAVAALDFDTFFSLFHGLFFAAGTWTFPSESMLIRLFPERFWVSAGIAWGTLSLVGAAVLAVAARYVPVAARERSGSRTAEDV